MRLTEEWAFLRSGLVVLIEELGLVSAPKQERTALCFKACTRKNVFFGGILFEIVGPAALVFEGVLDLDVIAANQRERVFVSEKKEITTARLGEEKRFALKEAGIVGDAHGVEQGGEDINVAGVAEGDTGAKKLRLVKDQGGFKVFVVAVSRMCIVSAMLSKSFAVIACDHKDGALELVGVLEVLEEAGELLIEQVEVVVVASERRMNVLKRPILWAVIGVRIVRDEAGVGRPKRLFHGFEVFKKMRCGVDFVASEDAAWVVGDGEFCVIDQVLVSRVLHHPIRKVPVEGARVDQIMVISFLGKSWVSRDSKVFA